jgi:glycosyltransferase involved in cell wall biosynthesis
VPGPPDPDLSGRHVLLLNWRDTGNPEGGGAELYLEKMALGLVARGATVTHFSAAYPGAASEETVDGIRFVRRGSKLTVYPHGLALLRSRRLGRVDAVVDVQNGMPFLSRAVRRLPVVVLVHHVHREQWQVVYPGTPGRVGWWVESALAPRLYRHCQYVAVSRATREELRALGVADSRIAVVHNGTEPVLDVAESKTPYPSVCVVGRLVPHKRVEHAIDSAVALRKDHPRLRLRVVGSGWWEAELKRYAQEVGAGDTVTFEGHVDEATKQQIYASSWLMALPSLKEGWGLVVGEAGLHGTPTVAYRSAGGTRESISDGVSGLLVDDQRGFTRAVGAVLDDPDLRTSLSKGARDYSGLFTWDHAQAAFARVIEAALAGRQVSTQDEAE